MALPLLWLGAGAAALFAAAKVSELEQKRSGRVARFPGECSIQVEPMDGAIVCCGIYGIFDHSGIWLDGNIIELKGNGLIRGISAERFMQNRSGDTIYVACGESLTPLIGEDVASRASSQLYQYREYDLFKNNCHRFVHQCLTNNNNGVTSFSDLNASLADYFQSSIHWQPIK